jgi:REase_DpnII-MboI
MDPARILDQLIAQIDTLDERASRIQGDRELLVDRSEINSLVADYQDFFARALQVLPPELHDEFEDLYEGGNFVKRIKTFLEAPDAVNPFFEENASMFSYWQHTYEETFRSSILDQRQLLTTAKQALVESTWNLELELVERLGRGFRALVDALQRRHDDRPPFEVNDEYDVQDLIEGVLRAIFGDVRREDPSPTRAGGSTRVDFLLKEPQIVVEMKMTRKGLRDRDIGDQLIEDIERYRSHPDCAAIVAIVYDPERHLSNPRGIEADLSGKRDGLEVRVVVVSG